jgi:hypothetical protein
MRATPGHSLIGRAGIGLVSFLSIVLLGCGHTSISGSGAGAAQGTGTTAGNGGATGNGGTGGSGGRPTAPVPGSFQPLTGCTNPNTGISNNDWGVGTDPVYTVVDNTAPVIGTPTYSSNSIFWISREVSPGQSVLMTGAFTDATKTARVAFIPPGTNDWQSLVQNAGKVVPTIQQGTTGLSFIVPSDYPAGIFGFEIQDPSINDPSAAPLLELANVPSINWVIGVPSVTDPNTALQHRVYDCGAEPGETLRIFGKNFVPNSQVVIQSSKLAVYALTPSKLDSNSIAVTIPGALSPGTYNIWVGGAPWSVTSSPASQITIFPPPSLTVRNATCSNLIGDGTTDNAGRLQSCLDSFAPAAGSNLLVYIAIPAGKFVLKSGVKPHPYEFLAGSSPTSTTFIGSPLAAPPNAWFTVPQYFGLANLSLQAPANPYILISSDWTTGSPNTSGHLFFNNVNFQSTFDASNGAEAMFALAGPDIQVYNSFFLSGSNQVFDIDFGDGGIVCGNQIVVNNWTGLGFSDSQNLIFENNSIRSENVPGQGADGHSGGSGLSITRGNNQYGPSALSRDIYVGYNTFQNMGSKDQQIITNDGDGGSYYGPVASSTATTVILADDPAWNWMGTTNPQAASMAIISGTGAGQYSFVQSYSGRTINLVTPWKVVPDITSVVVISQYELNMTIAHNTISNTLGVSIVLGDALEGVIEDNVLTNSGYGILISAFGPYGGPAAYGPVINTDVLRNTIAVGTGSFIVSSINDNVAGIGILDMPGCLLSGLVIRDNLVPPIETIFSTNGLNEISANLIEQNQANWLPTFPIPGFLVQDNTPQ